MEAIEEVSLLGYTVPHSILVVRNDRLGDVVLTLPLLRALRMAFPGTKVGVLVSAYAAPLLGSDSSIDRLHVEGPDLLRELKAERYERAIVLWGTRKNAQLIKRVGIPQRWGPRGRWYSYLFNRRLNLRRSRGDRSEAEYNLDYLRAMHAPAPLLASPLALTKKDKALAAAWLKKKGPKGRGPLVMMHPGSGGSAQNWSPQRYAALGSRLVKDFKAKLLITAAPQERELANQLNEALSPQAKKKSARLLDTLELPVFAALCGMADLFVSASTGPMHLAAAGGAPTLSLFPPIRAMSALRWGPLGNRHAKLSPQGLGFALRGGKRVEFNYTSLIDINQTADAADFLLRQH